MTLSDYNSKSHILNAFKRYNMHITDKQAEQIMIFIRELLKWNRIITLISETDRDHIIDRHIINSIMLFEHINTMDYKHIADIGSGNGFPGIILAICYPQTIFSLIEHRGKKASFLKQAIQICGLENADVHSANAKTYNFENTDLVLARAVGDVYVILNMIKSPFNGHIAIYRRNDIMLYNNKGNICST